MDSISCPICLKAISRQEWPAHVRWHDQGVRQLAQRMRDGYITRKYGRAYAEAWYAEMVRP